MASLNVAECVQRYWESLEKRGIVDFDDPPEMMERCPTDAERGDLHAHVQPASTPVRVPTPTGTSNPMASTPIPIRRPDTDTTAIPIPMIRN